MRLASISLMPAVVLLAGCSGSDNGPIVVHPVAGKVIYDGKPAAGVVVTLIPNDAPMVPRIPQNPHAVTGSDGRFSISTFAEGDGAAEGGYQIVLSWPGPTEENSESDEEMDTDRLMGWYDGTHSNFGIRVQAGQNEVPTFNLRRVTQPPPVSEGVPGRN